MDVFLPVAMAVLLAPSISLAQPGVTDRAEVPIKQVVLSDGARRYTVSLMVGGTEVLAGLDSGSTGFRILPGTLKQGDAQPSSRKDSYSYLAGTKLSGTIANAIVALGSLSGKTSFQLVNHVGYTDDNAHDGVEGCLINVQSHQHICGAVVLDRGGPGIRVVTADRAPKIWRSDTPATLVFADRGHIRVAESIMTDRKEQASHLSVQERAGCSHTHDHGRADALFRLFHPL